MERHNNGHRVLFVIWGFCILLWVPAVAHGATYYVRTDGNNANTGLTNTPGGAWRTIDYAADRVSAGAVVRVQTGTYSERVTPSVNGTSVSNTITFVADGPAVVCGWDFSNSRYIRVIGFVVDTDAGTCSQSNGCVQIEGANSYLEFWNNEFRDANYNGIRIGLYDEISNSLIVGNTFHNFGIGNGSGMAVGLRGNGNVIAYNEVYNSHPDGFLMAGSHNRWVNNHTHDFSEASGGHADVFQTGSNDLGWSYNLIEANFQVGLGNLGDEHTAQISHGQASMCSGACGPMRENIFRHNVWHNVSNGTVGINQASVGPITFTRYYHNTTAGAQRHSPTTRYGIAWYGPNISDGYIHNNIEYKSWGDDATSNLEVYYVSGGLTADHNLAFDPNRTVTFASPWTSQTNPQSNVDPRFVDYANDNFALSSGSGATGMGGALTETVTSGTGTTFSVATNGGGFFRGPVPGLIQYGGNLGAGDVITVGDDRVRISRVSGDSITATAAFSWGAGEPVFYGRTASRDIGAYPYVAGGYALTAGYSRSGGAVTVSVSNEDLVRFVVCYEDGIPAVVDNSSPFTCSVGDGALDVRVYPLYPSKRLFVAAASGESSNQAPAAPVNVTIK